MKKTSVETELTLGELIAKIRNTHGVENLKEVMGEELGTLIFELLEKAEPKLTTEPQPDVEELLLSHYGWSETTMSDDFMQEFRKKYRIELAFATEWATIQTEQLTKRLETTQRWLDEFQGSTASLILEIEQLKKNYHDLHGESRIVRGQLEQLDKENEKLKEQVKELKEENERLTDILENRLIGGPECDATRASDAYFYLGDMLNVQAGGSVIDTVQQLQQRIKELEGELLSHKES